MPLLGATYSHRHSQYLRLDPKEAFEELLNFGFDSIRLACYWDEIEKEKGVYDFSAIRALLARCEKKGQHVVLTVGMKAPRWPEYYFPKWLPDKAPERAESFIYPFIDQAIDELKDYACITHWQIENEPLDPSGPEQFTIPVDILTAEIALVRNNDKRPILVNLWGNELQKRALLPEVVPLADIIGLDLYYKVPLFAGLYRGPNDSDKKLAKIIEETGKPIWITELQAEPWEYSVIVSQGENTPSMNEQLLQANYTRAAALKPEAIFLWGFEYWLMRKNRGDERLWNAAREIVMSE